MTAERVLPYWESDIKPRVIKGDKVFIAAHGNSMRALIMELEGLSGEEIGESFYVRSSRSQLMVVQSDESSPRACQSSTSSTRTATTSRRRFWTTYVARPLRVGRTVADDHIGRLSFVSFSRDAFSI